MQFGFLTEGEAYSAHSMPVNGDRRILTGAVVGKKEPEKGKRKLRGRAGPMTSQLGLSANHCSRGKQDS